MKNRTEYTAEFKAQLLSKVFSPNSPNTVELAQQAGIPYSTLYNWIKMSKKQNGIEHQVNPPLRPHSQPAEAKLRAVMDTLDKTDSERGEYCRAHGFHSHHLESWKAQILEGLEVKPGQKEKAEHQQLTKENKHLKSELSRKDKALAEVSALLILKKKADLLWGKPEDD